MVRETEREIEEEEKELLAESEVSLVIENYDEIFSSFDPRPYSRRALSVDFLDEARRATREIKPGVFELRFLLPFTERKLEKEGMIKKRLKEHFKKHHEMLEGESKKVRKKGLFISFIGFFMMLVAAWIVFYGNHEFIYSVLKIIFEPGGWFTLWTGLDILFFGSKEGKSDLEFYGKMVKAEIVFSHYG
jgi:hypothetical protein